MICLSGSYYKLYFEIKDSSGNYANPFLDVDIYDPTGIKRIEYDENNVYYVNTGKLEYSFQLPDDVYEGEWRARIQIDVNATQKSYRDIYFHVEDSGVI